MSLHLFDVSITIPSRNIQCSTRAVAANDVDAINATKARLEDCLDNFVGGHRRKSDKHFKMPTPEELYADAQIQCKQVVQPQLFQFSYDRIRSTEPFHV